MKNLMIKLIIIYNIIVSDFEDVIIKRNIKKLIVIYIFLVFINFLNQIFSNFIKIFY